MKTIRLQQFFLLILTSSFINIASLLSQEAQLSSKEKKAMKKAVAEVNYRILDSLVSTRSFILEANTLRDKYGLNIPVNSSLNFIKVVGENGVLQTGYETGIGYNGVGGLTAEGKIGTWRIERDPKKLTITVQFSILTNLGNYDIFLRIGSADNANATLTGLRPGNLIWDGQIVTLDNSRIFKGYNSY